MLSKHLIFTVISFLAVAIIYSTSSTLDIFGEIKDKWYRLYTRAENQYCQLLLQRIWQWYKGESTAIYCAQCYDDGTGNLACDAYDKVESIKPPGDNYIPPKGKGGLLGLLDETSPTIQQLLPETITPQKNIPSTDLLSNLEDNILTSVPKQDERLNLLEQERDEEFPIIETDTDNENILKD